MVRGTDTEVTYRYEKWRAVASGVLETAGTTFLLLIAVRWFEAGATAKALVAGGGSLGLMLTPLVVSGVAALGWKTARAASLLAAAGSGCFLIMAAAPKLGVFVAGSVLAMTASSAAIPLLTQIYQENYPEKTRGHLFSRTVMVRIGTAALFSDLGGRFLSEHVGYFRWLLLFFAATFAFASYCLARYPSRMLTVQGGTHPFRALRFAREDALFRRTLICWMLMGFANLMMFPMRVEYLANPQYGLTLSVGEIAFLIGVIPNAARLVLSPIWGWLFDRTNFFALRAILNVGFALGILSFFASSDVTGLLIGAVVFGISNAGGDVAWSLWVTKFAPAEHVADYMSVHTCLTGVRGILAPLVAFHLVRQISVESLGWISAGLIVASSLMLIPEIRLGPSGRPAKALVEEVSD
ncbi:MAG: MFS transporter [Verrucomicrobia bacterium]|nr:MFS transporter [Verrucomicrobiota bacterium]